ncbi:polysaccharide biosynthesis C-terminal domain-containing protein [Mesonia ostreae]|uniref:Oligosaccharide flippase family protein n=1 Tax=Mesonia ostreae TaxID=861110 RepID=A0ABU2KIS6_9FLAO|nr:polysaccharide biosynthesis C-terminal domain-containing protein [Mesonia ostreae]MDT0294617.1 oligosaccharide flippase family protein [Mesonia ostreae]
MSTLKRFFQDTFIYGLATVLPRLMNFLLVPLLTGSLENADYSDNTTFYIYAAFFNVLLTYGMETSFFRYFSRHKEKNKIFSTAFISLTITTILFFAVVWTYNVELAKYVDLKLRYFNLLISVIALDTLVVIPFALLRATGKPIKFSIIKVLNIGMYVALNYFFLWMVPKFNISLGFLDYSNDLVTYVFIANLIASLFTFILLSPYFFKTKLVFDWSILKQFLNYGWPIMVAGLAYVINENFDKWLIPQLLGKDINGAYAACYKIAVFMTVFIQGFRLGAEPFFFNHAQEKNAKNTYALIMKYFVVLGSLMLVFIVAYLHVFKKLIVTDPSYWIAIDIVPIVLLANLMLGIYFNLAYWYKLTDKTRYGMYFSILGAVVTIALNYALIPVIGFMGAAYTTLIAYTLMVVISYLFGRKHYNIPYDLKNIGIYLGLGIGFAFSSFYVFDNNLIIGSLLVFLFLGIIYFKERKYLSQFLQR